jgi:N-acyl-D-aspartate/D-glutamate deacylase
MELFNADEERIPELITDPRVMVGLSDGGAHVDMLCDAGYCTYLLGRWVREAIRLSSQWRFRINVTHDRCTLSIMPRVPRK